MHARATIPATSEMKPKDTIGPPKARVKSVERAASILRALAASPTEGGRLMDIAATVGLDRTTVHRLLSTLADVGLVEQDGGTKNYRLGLELFALATAASNRYDLQDVARASISRLAANTGDTIMCYLRAADDGVCVDLETGNYPIKALPFDIGGRFPLGFGAAGIALLAPLPDVEIDQIIEKNRLRMQRFGDVPSVQLRDAIETFRQKGYAYSAHNGAPGIESIAIPALDRRGRPVAALAIATIAERLAPARRAELAVQLAAEITVISELLMRRPDSRRQRQQWEAKVRKGMATLL
ncbi:IclR family transcriptional regulator [Pusillimonas sp.]|uniref:IclR family transcriptional regulator n=1 Tax=Pusillimonas sp. TaxID=3040095 RepID=UPI0029BFCD0D|nr:IclR family transcriptional regulator [Pusillimonas sp.]